MILSDNGEKIINSGVDVVMGYWSDKSKLSDGSYTVEICKDFPYCV